MCERNDERTKALLGVGKSMTKTKGSLHSQRSIIEIHSFNRTVLINERSKQKGHQNGREDIIRVVPRMTTHPRAERLGNSLVVGRQRVSWTSGNLNACPNKGEVGFQTLGHEGLLV